MNLISMTARVCRESRRVAHRRAHQLRRPRMAANVNVAPTPHLERLLQGLSRTRLSMAATAREYRDVGEARAAPPLSSVHWYARFMSSWPEAHSSPAASKRHTIPIVFMVLRSGYCRARHHPCAAGISPSCLREAIARLAPFPRARCAGTRERRMAAPLANAARCMPSSGRRRSSTMSLSRPSSARLIECARGSRDPPSRSRSCGSSDGALAVERTPGGIRRRHGPFARHAGLVLPKEWAGVTRNPCPFRKLSLYPLS